MKKILFILLIIFPITCSAERFDIKSRYSDYSLFYEYEENGLWGIKFQDEICLVPQFDGLKPVTNFYNHVFLYKENGLWGIMCPTKIITRPLFDECYIEKLSWGWQQYLILFKSKNKYGVAGITGIKYLEAKYDSIKVFQFRDFHKKWKSERWEIKNNTDNRDIYFAVLSDGKWNLLDMLGNIVYSDFQINMTDKSKIAFGKVLEKYEIGRNKADKFVKDKIRHAYKNESSYQTKLDNFFNKYFRYDTIGLDLGDVEKHVYETTFIDVPWLEDSQEAKLERDPTNVYALRNILYENMPPLRDKYQFDATLDEESLEEEINRCYQIHSLNDDYIEIVRAKGYSEESTFYKDAEYIAKRAWDIIDANREGIPRVRKEKKWARTMNTMNSIASALTNTVNTLNSLKGNSGTIQSGSSTSTGSVGTKKKDYEAPYSLTANHNRNTDSRTYASYDSMLSKMRFGNEPYNDAKRKEYQSKMKALRQKWEQRGERFQHSENEDWLGK
ncbi:MAG: hypothetical protein IJY03_06870 [Prevotella sp.]|nr:hypothetical protein [Prevotella sp.]